MPRCAGLFVPLFALRSSRDLGVGDTESLKGMIDWCADHGFKVLQILPINETSDDNSPYNAISSRALDITTLAVLPELIPGLRESEFAELVSPELRQSLNTGPVPYRRVKELKWKLCEVAFKGFVSGNYKGDEKKEFEDFLKEEKLWLDDYSVFRALMERNGGHSCWEQWPQGQRTPYEASEWFMSLEMEEFSHFSLRARFYAYVQWLLYRQWDALALYADSRDVGLMGDIPFGVSRHSADVWAHSDQFDLSWCGGAPPEPLFVHDPFTATWGQNWGIPLYHWDRMEEDGFAWWKGRVQGVTRIFKYFRIDHVLGFYRIYGFPWQPQENGKYVDMTEEEVLAELGDRPRFLPTDDSTEENCEANRSNGEKLLGMILEAAGYSIVVAEDLGVVPDYVRPSLESLGISGFKIPMFERYDDGREYKDSSKYPDLTLATLSTHDHETMKGTWENWWKPIEKCLGPGVIPMGDQGLDEEAKQCSWELYRTQRFAGLDDSKLIRDYEPEVREAICRKLWDCKSWLAVMMITDLFGLEIRFNVPGPVAESNWSERLSFTVEDLQAGKVFPEILSKLSAELGRARR